MNDELPEWMREAFSSPRMAPYLRATGGDAAAAVRLYWWNTEVSAAFYGPLHCLEVTLRNSLHDRLREAYGRHDWWTDAPLSPNGLRLVEEARRKQARRGTGSCTADDLVAGLSFGFWVSLVSGAPSYDRRLWVPVLHKAFPHYSGRRRSLHDNLLSLVLLRNRIMHHEPVHHRDLTADHAKIYRMLDCIDPRVGKEVEALDRVPAVLRDRNDACGGSRPPRF
ncbi:hypothetical protein ACFV1B_15810 [Streptomyces sp. NPDC059637]|uniref:hypothetical protein n=1 Tax=Streptomyces sp. NPDC059637 TaxID=3347752 RepID=UPI00367968DF